MKPEHIEQFLRHSKQHLQTPHAEISGIAKSFASGLKIDGAAFASRTLNHIGHNAAEACAQASKARRAPKP